LPRHALHCDRLWVSESATEKWAVVAANGGILIVLRTSAGSNEFFYVRTIAGSDWACFRESFTTRGERSGECRHEDVVFFADGGETPLSRFTPCTTRLVALKTNGQNVDASNLEIFHAMVAWRLGKVFQSQTEARLDCRLGGWWRMTASAVSRFPDVERIDWWRFEPPSARQLSWLALNRGVLSDPRFTWFSTRCEKFLTNREKNLTICFFRSRRTPG